MPRTRTRTALRLVTATMLTAAGVLAGSAAEATPPGPGVTGRVIARTTVGSTDYILREVTIPPGQATGWHYHDGPLYGYVKQGTLSHHDSTCASDGVYPQGATIREPAEYVHIGRNLGDTTLVLEVLYVLPHGAPFARDAANPGCPFE